MDKEKLIRRLMETFITELEDHVRNLNRDLLALEKKPSKKKRGELIQNLFRTAHSLKGASRSVNVTPLEQACHRMESILAEIRDGTRTLGPKLLQLFFEAADAIQDAGKRLAGREDLTGAPIERLIPRLDSTEAGEAVAEPPEPAPAKEPPAAPPEKPGTVRVASKKLDALYSLSGELLVSARFLENHLQELGTLRDFVSEWEARWSRAEESVRRRLEGNGNGAPPGRRTIETVEGLRESFRRLGRGIEKLGASLAADGRELERNAVVVEEQVREARMFPFVQVVNGLDRIVRDIATALGKRVDLVTEGGEVELDRSILEGLKDPLSHLVRNAVDHGIESPEKRRAAGKSEEGRIRVGAWLAGAQIKVTVTDDGRGVDEEEIRKQARRKGMEIPADRGRLMELLFEPGFSTVPIVTEVSGRGVGLDVVRNEVESLRGTIEIDSAPGEGTAFTLTLPLTMTTVRAVLLEAGEQTFAVPVFQVKRLLRIAPEDIRTIEGREMIELDGLQVPLVALAEVLGLPSSNERGSNRVEVVVLAVGNQPGAFVVDRLVAEGEITIKGLGSRLRRVQGVSGATILTTGRVTLILNAVDLIRAAREFRPVMKVADALATGPKEARKRLLVVDDSVTTRSLLKSVLESAGYEVVDASDGTEAWVLLRESPFDLVVSDIQMPRMDGFLLTETIRRAKRFRDLPIVLVTALESEQDKAKGIEVGADAYIGKGAFQQKVLLDTIAQLL